MNDKPKTTPKTHIAEQMRTEAIKYSLEADVWEERQHKACVHALARGVEWLCSAVGDLERTNEQLKDQIEELESYVGSLEDDIRDMEALD